MSTNQKDSLHERRRANLGRARRVNMRPAARQRRWPLGSYRVADCSADTLGRDAGQSDAGTAVRCSQFDSESCNVQGMPVGQVETVAVSEAVTPRRHASFDAALLGGFALIAFALPIAGSYRGWYGSIAAHLAAFVVAVLTAVVLGSAAWHQLRSVGLRSSR
jgi:hypothetical protein